MSAFVPPVHCCIPDPFVPAEALKPVRTDVSTRWARHASLRSRALATTRRVIADEGREALSIRRLADALGVSSQTIYNHFGNRTQVIEEALNEHTTMMVEMARENTPGIDGLILLYSGYAACMKRESSYIRQATCCALSSKGESSLELPQHGARVIRPWLQSLSRDGTINLDVDTDLLAKHLSWIATICVYEWAHFGMDADYATEQLEFRICHSVLGAATEAGRRKLEANIGGLI